MLVWAFGLELLGASVGTVWGRVPWLARGLGCARYLLSMLFDSVVDALRDATCRATAAWYAESLN